MIGKATHGADFAGLARYQLLTSKSADSARLVWSQNLGRLDGDPATIAAAIGRRCAAVASLSRAKRPAYHVIYRGVGPLTPDQVEWLICETVSRHGLAECQAWAVTHGDDELHLGFNRVAPVAGSSRHRAIKVAHDYRIRAVLTKEFRAKFGLEHEQLDGPAADSREGRRRHTDRERAQIAKLQAEAEAAGRDPAAVRLPIDAHIRELAAEAWQQAEGDPAAWRAALQKIGLEIRPAGRGYVVAATDGPAAGMQAALSSIERRKAERDRMVAGLDAAQTSAAERARGEIAAALTAGQSTEDLHRQLALRGLALGRGRRGLVAVNLATGKVVSLRRAKLTETQMEEIQKSIDPASLPTPEQLVAEPPAEAAKPAPRPVAPLSGPTEGQIVADAVIRGLEDNSRLDLDDPAALLLLLGTTFVAGWTVQEKIRARREREAAREAAEAARRAAETKAGDPLAVLQAAEIAAGRRAFDRMTPEQRSAFHGHIKKAEADSYAEIQAGLDLAYQAAGIAVPADRDGRRAAIEGFHRGRVKVALVGALPPAERQAVDNDRDLWQARAIARDPELARTGQIHRAAKAAEAAVAKAQKRLAPPARGRGGRAR